MLNDFVSHVLKFDIAVHKFHPERQRITLRQESGQARPVVLDGAKRLKDCFTTDKPQLVFKDLGPEVAYKTLFFELCYELEEFESS